MLWEPSPAAISRTQMDYFRRFVNQEYGKKLKDYHDLYAWSVSDIEAFWKAWWKHSGILIQDQYDTVLERGDQMPGAKWFRGAKLNYGENCLRFRDRQIALISLTEHRDPVEITYERLYERVSRMTQAMRHTGVQRGDRVAGLVTNGYEAVVSMLATASLGAIWSSCSPDFGAAGIVDRFKQIQPKMLIAVDGYSYGGKKIDIRDKVSQVADAITDVVSIVVVPNIGLGLPETPTDNMDLYEPFLNRFQPRPIFFEGVPFNHPLFILYSSGTTGLPKSIVHGVGGTLLQHLKELKLHTDLRRHDRIFYYTTCGWMMWNWLMSSLAVGATLVLYDGSPFFQSPGYLMDMAERYKISVFGTSARYITALKTRKLSPKKDHNLSALRCILSTGSTLIEECYDYVYEHVKKEVMLSSISGGTDIVSCFALGNPTLPVYRGELQSRGLGMAVEAWDRKGNTLVGKTGELVCTKPFVSMPIYFWNDPESKKYRKAYFKKYQNIWQHGDHVLVNERGGVKVLGRSDATLNPGGVRIGTAEIYRAVENLAQIEDSLVVGFSVKGDEKILLFVKLSNGGKLDGDRKHAIKDAIKISCSPRHVPTKIYEVDQIPYTISGKKVELMVKQILQGKTPTGSLNTLANPESVDFFRELRKNL